MDENNIITEQKNKNTIWKVLLIFALINLMPELCISPTCIPPASIVSWGLVASVCFSLVGVEHATKVKQRATSVNIDTTNIEILFFI